MDEQLVFVNIGWMVLYKGDDNDQTRGGHKDLQSHNRGYEAWNFLPTDGHVYGYVPGPTTIKLTKFGALKSTESLDNVTVAGGYLPTA